MNHVDRVKAAINRTAGACVVLGELLIEPAFADTYLSWRGIDVATGPCPGIDHVIACCRDLKHDLIGIQAEENKPFVSDIHRAIDAGLFVFGVVNGAFQTLSMQMDLIPLLTEIARSPESVGKSLRQKGEDVMAAINACAAAGVHGIIIADDIAYRQGPLANPDFLETYLLPVWRAQVESARRLGRPVLFHSDGHLDAVLPLIVTAGFDGLQCIESAAGMRLHQVIDRYGERLCFMGNIDPALLTEAAQNAGHPDSATDRLKQAVTGDMALAVDHGGLILGTCSGLHAGMSPRLVHQLYALAAGLASSTTPVAR